MFVAVAANEVVLVRKEDDDADEDNDDNDDAECEEGCCSDGATAEAENAPTRKAMSTESNIRAPPSCDPDGDEEDVSERDEERSGWRRCGGGRR